MIIANAVFYGGTEAKKVYLGENLVWEKTSTPKPAHQIMGKFTDDSTSDVWKCKINGNDIVLPVDPTTKEFGYDYEGEITNLRYMFYQKKIKTLDISNLDTSKVTNMEDMLGYCNNLTSLDLGNLDTSNVKNMSGMFSHYVLTTLDVSNFDTSEVTDMEYMFDTCSGLTTLDVSNFDTSKVKNMDEMFFWCRKLTSLNLSGWNTSNVTNMNKMLNWCYSLSTVLGPITGIGASWDYYTTLNLSDCPLTNASAMVFINGLAEVTEARTITFSKTTYDTLTDEQIAVATSKGWNVVRYA